MLSACGHNIKFMGSHHPAGISVSYSTRPFIPWLQKKPCFAHTGSVVITKSSEVHSTICDAKTGTTFAPSIFRQSAWNTWMKKPQFVAESNFWPGPFQGLLAVAGDISNRTYTIQKISCSNCWKELVRKYAEPGIIKTGSFFYYKDF